MRIRRAVAADAPTIVEFNARLAAETEGVRLDRDRLRSGVETLLGDESLGFYLIAEIDGEPVGQLGLTFEWSDWRDGMFWWLQSVYVRPEHRRSGVLKALYEHVLELASARGACGIRLYVEQGNRPAQDAYRRLGFEPAVFHMYENDFVLDRSHSR